MSRESQRSVCEQLRQDAAANGFVDAERYEDHLAGCPDCEEFVTSLEEGCEE